MPFRFGNTVMTGMPILHLRARIANGAGREAIGWSACGIASMWFDKDYSKPEEVREADLLFSVRAAADAYLAADQGSAWEIHRALEPQLCRDLMAAELNELTAGFGMAMLDAAVIDAVCRLHGCPFHEALRSGLLGFDESLAGTLPSAPAGQIAFRHTVGLGDPLVQGDVTEVIGDGLPQTLEEVIDHYGARYFKIKVNNKIDESLERLRRIASVLEARNSDYQATLDGNEAFGNMESFVPFVEACASDAALRKLWERTLWIEQPVARQQALEESVAVHLAEISRHKPVIVDESDSNDQVVDRALELGYRGISAKNCKGIFRTLHSHLRMKQRGGGLVLSSEDLTNQPIVSNHQDLCVAAALGIRHSERNGHHFFKGFQFLSEHDRKQALHDYPSLYEQTADGVPTLRIHGGEMSVKELNASPGLGVTSEPDWSAMEPVDLPGQSASSSFAAKAGNR